MVDRLRRYGEQLVADGCECSARERGNSADGVEAAEIRAKGQWNVIYRLCVSRSVASLHFSHSIGIHSVLFNLHNFINPFTFLALKLRLG